MCDGISGIRSIYCSWSEVESTHLTYSPDSTIAATCVPVSSASLLAICVSEYVQESGVCIVISTMHDSVWVVCGVVCKVVCES